MTPETAMRSFIIAALLLVVSLPLQAADVPSHIAAAVAAAERSDKDKERDARDKPAALMEFAGITEGMIIADVFGGGGYWTELLARAVGPKGQVRLVNNSPYLQFAGKELDPRFDGGRLPNTERRVVETCDLKLGRGVFDLILIVMSYHDLYYVDEKVAGRPSTLAVSWTSFTKR